MCEKHKETKLIRILLIMGLATTQSYAGLKGVSSKPASSAPAKSAPAPGTKTPTQAAGAKKTATGPTIGGARAGGATTGGARSTGPTTSGPRTGAPTNSTKALASRPTTASPSRNESPRTATRANSRGQNLAGGRRVTVTRPDGSRVVSEPGNRGYVERPFMSRGQRFEHRTYFAHGRAYDRFYRPYLYRGVPIEVYVPAVYYPALYYSWVYALWVEPVTYAWDFTASPWYAYYGVYFAPAPLYPSASLWLTDYIISASLMESYQARLDANQPLPSPPQAAATPLNADIKEQIAQEVRSQIAIENAEALKAQQGQDPDPQSSGIARVLADGHTHTFVVGRDLDLTDAKGMSCLVTPGDVLQLRTPPSAASTTANLVVVASKGGRECGQSVTVSIALDDLQDMQNNLRERIDQGLGQLQSNQGKGGLPQAPASIAGSKPTPAPVAQGAPPSEPNIAGELSAQSQESNRAAAEAGGPMPQRSFRPSGAFSGDSNTTVKNISLGMRESEVTEILGPPKDVVNLGVKKLYVYSDMKVTLNSGKVVNVE